MKITKLRRPQSENLWKGTCRQCESEAEATKDEMTHIAYDQKQDETFSWERCPVCQAGGFYGYGGMLFCPAGSDR